VLIGSEVGAPNQSLLFIRGQGYNDVEMDQAPPVGVIQDGVAFGTSTGQLASMFDVCSVEVDRGPQGIFYGKNTTAGLINITRCRPTRQYGADVSAGYGSFNDGFVRGVFNAPLGDKGGVKIAAQYHTNDGYLKDVFDGKNVGGDHMFGITGVVDYDLTNWLNANLTYDHISESGGGNPVQYGDALTAGILGINSTTDPSYNPKTGSPIGLSPMQVDTRPGSVSDTYRNDVISLILKAKTPIGDAVSQTAYVNQSDGDNQDYDGTCQFYPGCTGVANNGNALIGVPLEALRTQTFKQFTQEERLSGAVGPFDYLVGAYYYHSFFTLDQITDLTVAEFDQHSDQKDDSWSEFGNLDWNIIQNVKLSAGVRNISETKNAQTAVDYYSGGMDIASILGQPQYNFEHTWSHVITRFNAQWQVIPSSLLYANRSEGFRSGGFSVRETLSETIPGQSNYGPGNLVAFQPETDVTYEIGAKNRFFDNALTFNIDGFINDIKNYQETSVIETPGYGTATNTYVINLPKVEIKGIELDANAAIGHWISALDGLTLSGNAGFQHGDISNGQVNGRQFSLGPGGTGGADGSIADLTGTQLARLPSDNFTLRGTYGHALGPNDGRLTTTVGYSWIAKYSLTDYSPTQPDYQPSYGLLDASATYRWQNYYVKLSGKNLTQEYYRTFSLPTVFIQGYAPPRTVEIEFGAKF
jgi:iron complex outermembrane receptor protein